MMRSHSIGGSRHGATLVEVLMALLVMAVGVVSVFTLFPLSIMRSIKANQLTNAKLVEENARQIILANPQLVTGAPTWSPNFGHGSRPVNVAVGSSNFSTAPINSPSDCWVTPRARPGRALPESNILYYTTFSTTLGSFSGYTSRFEPSWRRYDSKVLASTQTLWTDNIVWDPPTPKYVNAYGGYKQNLSAYAGINSIPNNIPAPISDGTITWNSYRHSLYPADPTWSAYVVDPIGWHQMDSQSLAQRDNFGQLDRIHSQLTPSQADELFSSLDTWSTIQEPTVPVSISTGGPTSYVEFEPQVDLSESRKAPIGNQPRNRLVFQSDDGRRSIALPIDISAGALSLPANQIAWNGTLPSDFNTLDPTQIATVRVDAYEQRYSWMMTVLMSPKGEAKIDCVVFHNRSFNPLDEEAVSAVFQGSRATLNWPAARSAGDLPIKEGGFVFDAVNGHWYRIQKIVSYDNTVTPRIAVLDLETAVTVETTTGGSAIVLPNIVKIFHLDME